MATCFTNNVYCCYLPAHTSHGLQPLDNGPFNALKAAYRKELAQYATLSDSTPVDKVNFIRAYANARQKGLTEKNILSGWRVTGNWPISRSKALRHPEIQADKIEKVEEAEGLVEASFYSEATPRNSRQIRDIAKGKTPRTRRRYGKIAKGWEAKEQAVAIYEVRMAKLKEEVARLQRKKQRKAIPNPNARFMALGEVLGQDEATPEVVEESSISGLDSDTDQSDSSESSIVSGVTQVQSPIRTTRSGRIVKRPRYM